MNFIQLYITRLCVFVALSIFASPLYGLLLWLIQLKTKYFDVPFIGIFLALCMLAVTLLTAWITSEVSQLVTFRNYTFSNAIIATFGDMRVRLSLLPIIGHYFSASSVESDKEDDNS